MKKSLLPLLALLFACGCNDPSSEVLPTRGQATLACETQQAIELLTRSTYELPTSLLPASGEQFKLNITGAYVDPESGDTFSYEREFATLAQYNEELPMLFTGNYTATVSLGDPTQEGAELPCFAGSHTFKVVARKQSSEVITAALSNAAIRLSCNEWFNNYYSDATFTVTTASGNSFEFAAQANEPLIFVAPSTTLTLTGHATKRSNGTVVTFPATQLGTTTPRTLTSIVIEASAVGAGTVNIFFDETLHHVTPVVIELNPEV